jgi:hypothetical protein
MLYDKKSESGQANLGAQLCQAFLAILLAFLS